MVPQVEQTARHWYDNAIMSSTQLPSGQYRYVTCVLHLPTPPCLGYDAVLNQTRVMHLCTYKSRTNMRR